MKKLVQKLKGQQCIVNISSLVNSINAARFLPHHIHFSPNLFLQAYCLLRVSSCGTDYL